VFTLARFGVSNIQPANAVIVPIEARQQTCPVQIVVKCHSLR